MDKDQPQTHRQNGCILLAGPTASGKSALAIAIAEEFDGVIINADSMQVYDGLRVLTARPSAAEEASAPHRLYGVLDPADYCNAARWRDMALKEIEAARAAGKLPILVGGTGLYFDILTKGIAEVPDISEEVRGRLRDLHKAEGNAVIHARLREKDPEMA
ncbi:tRNA (adenosine(37)-N6)-dimethylallyltransferase MiaA, partial [uncultured Sneathiella sp.]|uniref:tRNA (adenosine(37)-N6)-dimethylallyltransferase n=1 Tax=uncultured Sneathiella sp. TaxID=879315 RepID=UPI0030D99174